MRHGGDREARASRRTGSRDRSGYRSRRPLRHHDVERPSSRSSRRTLWMLASSVVSCFITRFDKRGGHEIPGILSCAARTIRGFSSTTSAKSRFSRRRTGSRASGGHRRPASWTATDIRRADRQETLRPSSEGGAPASTRGRGDHHRPTIERVSSGRDFSPGPRYGGTRGAATHSCRPATARAPAGEPSNRIAPDPDRGREYLNFIDAGARTLFTVLGVMRLWFFGCRGPRRAKAPRVARLTYCASS